MVQNKENAKPTLNLEDDLDTTVDNMDEEMDTEYLEESTAANGNGSFHLVDQSQAYDDIDTENSPDVANIPLPKGKGIKRKNNEDDEGRPATRVRRENRADSGVDEETEDEQAPVLKPTKGSKKGGKPKAIEEVSLAVMALPVVDAAENKVEQAAGQKPAKGSKRGAKPKVLKEVDQATRDRQENRSDEEETEVPIQKPAKKAKRGAKPKVMEEVDSTETPPVVTVIGKKPRKQVPPKAARKDPPKAKAKEPTVEEPAESRGMRARTAIVQEHVVEPHTIKIKIPVPQHSGKLPKGMSVRKLLDQTMEEIGDTRRGVTFKDVKRYLYTTFDYDNVNAIKLNVKSLISSGVYKNITGNGLNGRFKVATKRKSGQKRQSVEGSDSTIGTQKRRGSKTVKAMTEVKPKKRGKSLSLNAVKTPKRKTSAKKTTEKTAQVAEATKKRKAKEVVKKTSGKIKASNK